MTVLLTYCTLAAILLVGSMCLEMKRKPMLSLQIQSLLI